MTYTEALGHKPIDWLDFVTNEPIRGFADDKWDEYDHLSLDWKRCAVAQLTNNLPRKHNGSPVNKDLVHLGFSFSVAFHARNRSRCEVILQLIKQKEREIMCRINGKAKAKKVRQQWWRRKFNLK